MFILIDWQAEEIIGFSEDKNILLQKCINLTGQNISEESFKDFGFYIDEIKEVKL